MRRLLLISNGTRHGGGFLEYCAEEIEAFLGDGNCKVAFVPYALADRDGYAAKAASAFKTMGYELVSVHQGPSPQEVLRSADAVFVGGGNTFRLLRELRATGLYELIRELVDEGMPYMGASAGTNMSCPTIRTTNDMPIVEPPSFDALGLIPFQINPHYLDPDPGSKHMGETRETRINEFHEENSVPVLGLRECTLLRVEGDKMTLHGGLPGRLFQQGRAPIEYEPNSDLSFLLG